MAHDGGDEEAMSETELIEKLAAEAHASWSRYVAYLLGNLEVLSDGALYINAAYVAALRRQIALPYADLSAAEQQADRDEVAHILPIIREYEVDLLKRLGHIRPLGKGGYPGTPREYDFPFEGPIPPLIHMRVDPFIPEDTIGAADADGRVHLLQVKMESEAPDEAR
jgi:hypothetical protein